MLMKISCNDELPEFFLLNFLASAFRLPPPAFLLALLLLASINFLPRVSAYQQTPARLSLAIMTEDRESVAPMAALAAALDEAGIAIEDQVMTAAAAKPLQFADRMNLTCDEARNLGLALGTDFFLIMRAKSVERADVGAKLYGQCYIAVDLVNARSGKLIKFDFIETQAPTTMAAMELAIARLKERAQQYAQMLQAAYEQQFQLEKLDAEDESAIEPPPADSPAARNFQPPVFLARNQPEYTETARKMAVSAVVEVNAVLRRDGHIGKIELARWAGFGLDESAIAAIRQLKFKPATLNGQPIGCRALIRYNFNYKHE